MTEKRTARQEKYPPNHHVTRKMFLKVKLQVNYKVDFSCNLFNQNFFILLRHTLGKLWAKFNKIF